MFAALFLAVSEGSEDNVGDFEQDPRARVIEAALGRVGAQYIEAILGYGSFGVAAKTLDGKVVKLTSDPAEVQVGAVLVGKDLPHVVAVYGSWFIRGLKVNAVVGWDDEEQDYTRKSARVGLLVEQLVSTQIARVDRDRLTKIVFDFKEETGNDFKSYEGLSAKAKREKLAVAAEQLQLVLENENFPLAQDVAEAIGELREIGVYAIDVHGAQRGRRRGDGVLPRLRRGRRQPPARRREARRRRRAAGQAHTDRPPDPYAHRSGPPDDPWFQPRRSLRGGRAGRSQPPGECQVDLM